MDGKRAVSKVMIFAGMGLLLSLLTNVYWRYEFGQWVNGSEGKQRWTSQTTSYVMDLWGIECKWLKDEQKAAIHDAASQDPTVIPGVTTAEVQTSKIAQRNFANQLRLAVLGLGFLLLLFSIFPIPSRLVLANSAILILSWAGAVDACVRYNISSGWIQ